ncbi:hypothetical protein F443_15533 [Phytophthora nicotianae P1569]|uniref:Uncharacterized protein n=1 Tax=Phytophthora nicotianae P1569 TaxID=1317065 RepID=V9EHW9_PHYNI|nr:hypothetical protein F443_15533 [Phytophthora nicotianae P1569]
MAITSTTRRAGPSWSWRWLTQTPAPSKMSIQADFVKVSSEIANSCVRARASSLSPSALFSFKIVLTAAFLSLFLLCVVSLFTSSLFI